VSCGGYDLLSWCFGQEEIARAEVISRATSDTWTRVLNHPIFMAAVMLVCSVSFMFTIGKAILTGPTPSELPAVAFMPITPDQQAPGDLAARPAFDGSPPTLPNSLQEHTPGIEPPKPVRVALFNARLWKEQNIGVPRVQFAVDYRIDEAGSSASQYFLVIKSTKGIVGRLRIVWVGSNSIGMPGMTGSQGSLHGALTWIDLNNAPFEVYAEVERWDVHTVRAGAGRVREKASESIAIPITEAPSQPNRFPSVPGPRDFPGRQPGSGPGGLPQGIPGPSNRPGGFPGPTQMPAPPGPPWQFPGPRPVGPR
jgi:hypothetical protein